MSSRVRSLTVLMLSLGLVMGTQATAGAAVQAPAASPRIANNFDDSETTPQDFRDWLCRWVPMACTR